MVLVCYIPYFQMSPLYINNKKFLLQVKEGMFDKEKFDDLCWMMTMKKNYKGSPKGALLSERDRFKLFCLFNLLSEDHYPLVMIPEEVKVSLSDFKDYVLGCEWGHIQEMKYVDTYMFDNSSRQK